jgi:hypothetical protein
MSNRQIRLDDLMGRVVRDASGRSVGRVFDVVGEEQGGEVLVTEYHLGPYAWLERLGFSARRFAGLDTTRHVKKLAWNELDISDPDHPVTRQR